jgi:hypothetical protein
MGYRSWGYCKRPMLCIKKVKKYRLWVDNIDELSYNTD